MSKLARSYSSQVKKSISVAGIEYEKVVFRQRTQAELNAFKEELSTEDHKLSLEELESKYETNIRKGLSQARADYLLSLNGPNSLVSPAPASKLLLLVKYLFTGFSALLWIGAILTFIGYAIQNSRDPENTEISNMYLGIVLIVVILITGIYGYYQEAQNLAIMESFNALIPKFAKVIRGGEKCVIPSEELVVGDMVELGLGECIPADIRIITSLSLKVDNSPITGESEPVLKSPNYTNDNPLETANIVFYSTYIVEGSAIGMVISTGDDTLIGHIAGLSSNLKRGTTTIQREINRFTVVITIIAVILGIIFFVISLLIGYDFFTSLTYFIAIIVANVPEGLPVTLTACLTLTAKRMKSKNCLVKNIKCIEALGSCNVICSDKTGTLTQNRMTVSNVFFSGNVVDVLDVTPWAALSSSVFKTLLEVAALCSRAVFDPTDEELPVMERKVQADASEAGIFKFVQLITGDALKPRMDNPKVCEIPFTSATKFQVSIHKRKKDRGFVLVMKGAPETILERCDTVLLSEGTVHFSKDHVEKTKAGIFNLGCLGERVLAFADKELTDYGPDYRFNAETENFPMHGLRFVGLISMIDPPRPTVPQAVLTCKSAGIRVIMVTGDHPVTAVAIAKKVHIISRKAVTVYDIAAQNQKSVEQLTGDEKSKCTAAVITGNDLRGMTGEELNTIIRNYKEIVFSRTSPQQKLKIVEAFQSEGNIVAVTGDGVNDSPALKKGDIGISMGITGSDVSKETANMILLDDNFATIVSGIEEGRLIFDNLKKSVAYLLTSNVPEIMPFVFLAILNIPQPLSVMCIMVIDVGTDLLPAISLAYENSEADIMKRLPRDMKRDRLINFRMIYLTYFQIGLLQTCASMLSYFLVMAQHGFFFQDLIGIRTKWESRYVNNVKDSYGEEWSYSDRYELQKTCHSAYFLSIVVTQVADLLICKTRRLSLFQQGMNNWVLNVAIVVELLLAALFVYTPGLNGFLQLNTIGPTCVFIAAPFGFAIFFYDEFRKFCIRANPTGWFFRETYY